MADRVFHLWQADRIEQGENDSSFSVPRARIDEPSATSAELASALSVDTAMDDYFADRLQAMRPIKLV